MNISDSEQEILVNDGHTLHLMWQENNDEVMYQTFDTVSAMATSQVQNISNASYSSSNPSLTLASNAIAIAFVDERSQGAQPEIYGPIWPNGQAPRNEKLLITEGQQAKLLWAFNQLYLASVLHSDHYWYIDPRIPDHNSQELSTLSTKQIYQSDQEIK